MLVGDIVVVSTLRQKFREHLKLLYTGFIPVEMTFKHIDCHASQSSPDTIMRPEDQALQIFTYPQTPLLVVYRLAACSSVAAAIITPKL